MSGRPFVALASVFVGAVAACTLTRPLDYLTRGEPDAGEVLPPEAGGSDDDLDGVETIAREQQNPRCLAQDGENLYWSADKAIMAWPKAGGEPRAVATTLGRVHWLTPDAKGPEGTLYVVTHEGVFRVPKKGGELTLIEAETPAARAAVVKDDFVVVLHGNGNYTGYVKRFGTDGGTGVRFSPDGDDPLGIALWGSSVYWAGEDDDGYGVVFELPVDVGVTNGGYANMPPNAIRAADPADVYPRDPFMFGMDEQSFFYGTSDGTIFRLSRLEANPPPDERYVPVPPTDPKAFAIGADALYVVDGRPGGSIIRVAKEGPKDDKIIAREQEVPTSVVVDDRWAYFTVQGSGNAPDGAVKRVPK